MDTKTNLEKNNFIVHTAKNAQEARLTALEIIPKGSTIGFGGSMTVEEIGLKDILLDRTQFKPVDQYEPGISRQESLKRRADGMFADVYVTGTNAITEDGTLVNVDGFGNRVAGQIVANLLIIVAGKNKIVKDYNEAIERIRSIAAPLNAKRLKKNTPCVETGRCMDCSSEERICNYTTIIHKGKNKTHVIIVDKELGL